MVTFRREIALWRETGVTQRALMIRDDVDTCWLACQMQHNRITDPGPAILSDPQSGLIQRRIDVDLFMVSLHRLHTVAKLAADVADPRNVLLAALERFTGLTAGLSLSEGGQDPATTIENVRHVFEHWQNLEIRGGLGLAGGADGWWISYRNRMFETKDLLAAAGELHRAVRAAVDRRRSAISAEIILLSNCATRPTLPGPRAPSPISLAGRLRRWRGYKPTCTAAPTAPA
jgi:hypothetical protein